MTIKCKFSPLGKPKVDSYIPGTVIFENVPEAYKQTIVHKKISEGVYELMCCSGGGGRYCYIGCNNGAAGAFFKGVVYFDSERELEIKVGGCSYVSSPNGLSTEITGCIYCQGGLSANAVCGGNTPPPRIENGMVVLSTEINAGGSCGGGTLFPGTKYGGNQQPGYFKLTYLRLEP